MHGFVPRWRAVGLAFLCGMTLLASLAGCGSGGPGADPAPGKKGIPVKLQLNWFPEAEHGGYYAALVHGYFEEEGLDVTILPGGPNAPVLQQVAGKQVPFGVANADRVVLARQQEAALVAVMAPIQIGPRCILVHEASGITSFDQLENVKLAVGQGDPFVDFLKLKLPLTGVEIVPYTGSVSPFLLNPKMAQQGYVFSEPFVIQEQGVKARSLLVADLGYNPYASTLIVHQSLLDSDPELVGKMTRASIRGWRKYLEDPTQTNAEIHRLNPEMSLAILDFGVKTLQPLVLPHGLRPEWLGEMTSVRWTELVQNLEATKLIKPGEVDPAKIYTTRFLGVPLKEDDAPPAEATTLPTAETTVAK